MKGWNKEGSLVEMNLEEKEGLSALRHTGAHILAQAVKRLYPEVKCGIGPSIENGFYYDFDFGFEFTSERLAEVSREMKQIVKENLPLKRFVLDRSEAISLMAGKNEPYKVQLVEELPLDAEISFFEQGEYVDLCAGPHAARTGAVKAFQLTSVAGAYWKGNENNKMLTRIYGTAFQNAEQLSAHLKQLEEAKRRDHRRLGRELELFTIMEEGPGFPFFLPKGVLLKNLLIEYWRSLHQREGYQEISSPMMLTRELWETSGHWALHRDEMYTSVIDDVDFAIKPMNCPGSMLVYKMKPHSYKEFPLRIGELGLVHRHEKSGQLHGLMRVRAFTQDDAHIFMTEDQIREQIKAVVRLIDEVYNKFGFAYHVELSTRPEKSIGSDEDWALATVALAEALKELGLPYVVNEGDGAFYGPKIDFHLKDSIGRTWQCGTIQLDFQLPQRFEAEYIGRDGEKHRPIMIHRVIFGSIERFIGILIEHYEGKLPLWLSPVQIKLLPISNKFSEYGRAVMQELQQAGFRCELDDGDEKIGFKIREAQLDKVPYMVIIGQKEQEEGVLSIRKRDEGDKGIFTLCSFLELLKQE